MGEVRQRRNGKVWPNDRPGLGVSVDEKLIIRGPVFWIDDFNYVWAAGAGALAAFWIGSLLRSTYRGVLYLDALGAALFAVIADKVLVANIAGPVAVIMGVLTGIGGGLIRDVLAGRPTLLMSREIYATSILLGCIVFVALRSLTPQFPYSGLVGFAMIFGLRALAVHQHLEMPGWLTHQQDEG